MIDVKQAVKTAREYMQDIYEGEDLAGFFLEEVELSEDEKFWYITFGFDTQRPTAESGLIDILRPKYVRDYKTIKLNAETGEAKSVKIRAL